MAKTEVDVDNSQALFQGVSPKTICWMSHTDYIEKVIPEGFAVTAHTPVCPVAGMECAKRDYICRAVSSGGKCIPRKG